LAIKAIMYKYALKEGIKYILRGNDFRSEGKQPKEWTYADSKQLNFIHKKFGNGLKLKTYPGLTLLKIIYAGAIRKIKDVRPFYYLVYNKQDAKAFLIEKFDWKDYGGHHHENLFTKFTMAYWLPGKFGIDKRKINLSAQVLSGKLSREQALDMLKLPFDSETNLQNLKDYTIKKLGIGLDEFNAIWLNPNKNTFDFPSNYNLVYKYIGHLKPLISKLYSYTPMSITERDYIKKAQHQ
jgi:hypothetical protein